MTIEQLRHEHPLLGGRPGDVALATGTGSVTYGELATMVDGRAGELGPTRRLVLLEARNDVETVVTYLAALAGGHPVLVAAPGDADRHAHLVEHYRPDVLQASGEGLRELHRSTTHVLHPDLAVLLSTSGSTGSPKLVRLSLANVVANARSIADYLAIRDTDRAITSLPLHYCYGLSVLTSHLVSGAGVVLTDLSVADACFWDLARTTGATSLAGVPYTYELLEASGFAGRELPSLRYLTQAGGRMDPARVRAFAELGRRQGWDLFVMYGQTEATARMAYLPPDLAAVRPDAVGIPIPGGSFRLDPVDGHDPADGCDDPPGPAEPDGQVGQPGVGELVYSGPNVMMGYAEAPADLARGPELAELRTGDLARQADDGLWEITGRLGRHAKLFGLRLDLDRVERHLADHRLGARIVVHRERLHVFVDKPRSSTRARQAVLTLTGLPASAVRVHRLHRLPHTPSGKPDYAALVAHADDVAAAEAPASGTVPARATAESIRDLYAVLLGRPDATLRDSFVDLGGDSLSYVETSARLGQALGTLPQGWQRLTPTALAASRSRVRRFTVPVDVSVLLRAAAVVLILVSHADIVQLQGGAHILLALAGYNLARFQLTMSQRSDRIRGILRSAAHVAVPAAVWIGAVALVTGDYRWQTALLLNGFTGGGQWSDDWQFWFLEALVWGYVVVVALVAVPWVHRWSRRAPFATAMVVLSAATALRLASVGLEAGAVERYEALVVLWCLALGWAAGAADSTARRLVVAAAALVSTVGFFGDLQRELVVVAGVLLILVDRSLPVPRLLASVVRAVAAASLWIYLTQWQVYPGIEDAGHPYLAVVAAVAVGIVAHLVYERVSPRVLARSRRSPRRRTASTSIPARSPALRGAVG